MGRELSRRFPEVHSGQWIEFQDRNGHGFAQPDHYIVLPDKVLLFECKYSQVEEGLVQIGQLYKPLLRDIYKLPVVGILVCKVLRWECKWLIAEPEEVLKGTSENIYTWHWIG